MRIFLFSVWKREAGDVDEGSSSEAGGAGLAATAVSDGLDGHGVEPDRTVAIAPGQAGPAAQRRSAGVLNAIPYLVRTGCGWRMPPKDFLPWQTVYWRFRRLVRRLLFRKIHDLALMLDREIEGWAVSPTTAFLDSTPLTGLAADCDLKENDEFSMIVTEMHIQKG
ncbi:transposase [Azospirillum baldaniorum]|nr:transposase [Azospirillum baldaniorum]